jgi:hypothetical protein
VGAVEAVWIDVVPHLCDLLQMAATLLNLVNLLIVEQNSKNSLKKVAPNGLFTREMLIRNSFGAVTGGA